MHFHLLVYISLLSQEFFSKKEGRDLENELQKFLSDVLAKLALVIDFLVNW